MQPIDISVFLCIIAYMINNKGINTVSIRSRHIPLAFWFGHGSTSSPDAPEAKTMILHDRDKATYQQKGMGVGLGRSMKD